MPLFHAQNVVQAQLLFPALDDEAVGVEQEQHREQPDDKHPQAHHAGHGSAAVQRSLVNALAQGVDGVEHHDNPHAGEQVGQVHPPVALQVGKGQLPVEAHSPLTHGRPRSFPGWWQVRSRCGRWPGTARRRSWRRGKSGGRPGRP